jgi:hypothetical protein
MRRPDGGGDGNDGGMSDGNPTISTFAGDMMDVVRGGRLAMGSVRRSQGL